MKIICDLENHCDFEATAFYQFKIYNIDEPDDVYYAACCINHQYPGFEDREISRIEYVIAGVMGS